MDPEPPKHRMIAKLIFAAIILLAIALVIVAIYGASDEKASPRGSAGPLTQERAPPHAGK